jgi:predicted oxidoreductase
MVRFSPFLPGYGRRVKNATVRLGKSGLKVSRIILGCLTYGTPEYQNWTLGEEEGLAHIKTAYDLGINTFDTANVSIAYECVMRGTDSE